MKGWRLAKVEYAGWMAAADADDRTASYPTLQDASSSRSAAENWVLELLGKTTIKWQRATAAATIFYFSKSR